MFGQYVFQFVWRNICDRQRFVRANEEVLGHFLQAISSHRRSTGSRPLTPLTLYVAIFMGVDYSRREAEECPHTRLLWWLFVSLDRSAEIRGLGVIELCFLDLPDLLRAKL